MKAFVLWSGSKFADLGWNFHGMKFWVKIVAYVLWTAAWMMSALVGAPELPDV
jgi:hypothetical protein